MFTRYTNGRELYWSVSPDGRNWTEAQKLASGGHYQMSEPAGDRVATAFNVHIPPGKVDARTNLYYVDTTDAGGSWRTVDGTLLETPIEDLQHASLVRDYRSEDRLVYLKDINFDSAERPLLLYITSSDHRPGPHEQRRRWTIAHWLGEEWAFHELADATHNYDMGSLYVEPDGLWRIFAPTETGPQTWGTGGELAIWETRDKGKTWRRQRTVTADSPRNHGYARRPVNAHPDFYAFWADGDPDALSISYLYFSDRNGEKVFRLPYSMEGPTARPDRVFQQSHSK